jgi:hypothetical protein
LGCGIVAAAMAPKRDPNNPEASQLGWPVRVPTKVRLELNEIVKKSDGLIEDTAHLMRIAAKLLLRHYKDAGLWAIFMQIETEKSKLLGKPPKKPAKKKPPLASKGQSKMEKPPEPPGEVKPPSQIE